LFSVWFLEDEYWNLFGNWIVEILLPFGLPYCETANKKAALGSAAF